MIRKTVPSDLDNIHQLARACAEAMIAQGVYQWNEHYPTRERFKKDIAIAIINPPTYKKTYLCPKEAVVSVKPSPPVRGNNTIGIRAVTAIGIASVIHQIPIHTVDARIPCASIDKPSGLKNIRIATKANGPVIRPIYLVNRSCMDDMIQLTVSLMS